MDGAEGTGSDTPGKLRPPARRASPVAGAVVFRFDPPRPRTAGIGAPGSHCAG